MNRTCCHFLVFVTSAVTLVGCAAPTGEANIAAKPQAAENDSRRSPLDIFSTPKVRDAASKSDETVQHIVDNVAETDAPKDPQPALDIVFRVEVYQLTLPRGAVSQSAEFWSRLNEQVIDPASYDVLQRNGLRVGEAPFSDWAYFKSIIDQHPGKAAQAVSVAREQKNMQLEMKKDIPTQNIFHFNARNTLTGRTYEKCDNLVSISFEPTPRRPGSMRLTLAPVVRSERKRLEYSVLNDERAEVQYIHPEMIYECNLRLDVPMESFIVVAASPEAVWPVSVGHAFLLTEGQSELLEQVLIIVPRPFRTE